MGPEGGEAFSGCVRGFLFGFKQNCDSLTFSEILREANRL